MFDKQSREQAHVTEKGANYRKTWTMGRHARRDVIISENKNIFVLIVGERQQNEFERGIEKLGLLV